MTTLSIFTRYLSPRSLFRTEANRGAVDAQAIVGDVDEERSAEGSNGENATLKGRGARSDGRGHRCCANT